MKENEAEKVMNIDEIIDHSIEHDQILCGHDVDQETGIDYAHVRVLNKHLQAHMDETFIIPDCHATLTLTWSWLWKPVKKLMDLAQAFANEAAHQEKASAEWAKAYTEQNQELRIAARFIKRHPKSLKKFEKFRQEELKQIEKEYLKAIRLERERRELEKTTKQNKELV